LEVGTWNLEEMRSRSRSGIYFVKGWGGCVERVCGTGVKERRGREVEGEVEGTGKGRRSNLAACVIYNWLGERKRRAI
jgi:hypothetical protein